MTKSSSSVPGRHVPDTILRDRYASLRAQARYLAYASRVSAWRGQEYDVSEDLVQEAMVRLWERSLRAERGEVPLVDSPERMVSTIQRNYCTDMKRREGRLVHFTQTDQPLEEGIVNYDYEEVDFSEIAIDNVYREALFARVAIIIVRFPDKQRTAILIDLANRMCFESQPTPLQAAFLMVGIRLQDYQRPPSADPVERSRHSSLVNAAYKRLAKTVKSLSAA